MNAKKFNFIVALTVTCAVSAFTAWCGGYNFDHRGSGVALWVFTTLFAGAMFGAGASI